MHCFNTMSSKTERLKLASALCYTIVLFHSTEDEMSKDINPSRMTCNLCNPLYYKHKHLDLFLFSSVCFRGLQVTFEISQAKVCACSACHIVMWEQNTCVMLTEKSDDSKQAGKPSLVHK